MKRHMTDEGWQIMKGLEENGYRLYGFGLENSETDISKIMRFEKPSVLFVQDKREWDVQPRNFREPRARFYNANLLRNHHETFKVTILKDCHYGQQYHMDSADEMGVHAWVVYYHPTTVKYLAPYVRSEHLIRTYHSINPIDVPEFGHVIGSKKGTIFSGAISRAYPERLHLLKQLPNMANITYRQHPGYHRKGSDVPDYMRALSAHKVAICTTSMWGHTFRKLIEATACGCRVVTDLPIDEIVPYIDSNLLRIDPFMPSHELQELLDDLCNNYDPEFQEYMAKMAIQYYNYNYLTRQLVEDIELMAKEYHKGQI